MHESIKLFLWGWGGGQFSRDCQGLLRHSSGHVDVRSTVKKGHFGKILWEFHRFPQQLPLRKHPLSSSSTVAGPDLHIFTRLQHWTELKQLFGIVFMKSCIVCNV